MTMVFPPTSFVAEKHVEQQTFKLVIRNYPLVRMHKSMIDLHEIDFHAGNVTGHLSHWTVYIRGTMKGGKRWIGIWLKLESPRPEDPIFRKTSHAEMRCTIRDKDGFVIKEHDTDMMQISTEFGKSRARGRAKFLDAEDEYFCPEELTIQITFRLHTHSKCKPTIKSTSALNQIMAKFQGRFSHKLRKDLYGLLKNPPSSDIKIISNDKKEFTVQRGILAVRSEVFAAMLSADMIEANSGVIQLPDISSKALEVLLTFLVTAELDPDWNHAEVLVELTNAAAKYQLPDLLQFLDATLGNVCKVENVMPLFTLAHQLELKTAEVELSKYISVHSISPGKCCEMLKGIIAFPGVWSKWTDGLPSQKEI